jgi:hypothetical protein
LENFKRKNTLKFTIFSIKFSKLEKLILGILPGILKLKNNFRNIFWQEHYKTRKKFENFNFSLENCKRRKNTLKITIFSDKFSNLGKLILGILP